MHKYGIEQTVRDSRIAKIYEGTNEIQAIDLLLRKVLDDSGMKLIGLLTVLEEEIETCAAVGLESFGHALDEQINAAKAALGAMIAARQVNPEWPLRVADDFLRGLSLTLLAWAWARSARLALPHQETDV